MANPRKWSKYYNLPIVEKARKAIVEQYHDRLVFQEDAHKYFLDGRELTCVSNVVKMWSTTDPEAMLDGSAARAKTDKTSPYYGMTREQIVQQWDEASRIACEFGTKCHAFGEDLFHYLIGDTDSKPVPSCPQEEAIEKFWNDVPESFIPVLAETRIFNLDSFPYAGTFDLLFYYHNEVDESKSGFVIMDYKTNGRLQNTYSRRFNKTMAAPFDDLIEENLSHYVIQTGLYQIPLEKLGFKVCARRLIWVKDDGTYEKVMIPELTARISQALKSL